MRSCATPRRTWPQLAVFRRFVKSASSPVGTSLEIRHAARSVPNVTEVTPSARGDGMGAWTCRRAVAAVLLALTAIAGCTDARPDTAPSSPSTSSTPMSSSATSDPQASAKAEVLKAYLAFWSAATDARAHPNRQHPRLAKYATDKALAAEQATIVLYRQQGIVSRGAPKLEPRIVALDMNSDPRTAQIRDCVDVSDVRAVYRSSGESALAPTKSFRHVATATATTVSGRWVIREIATDRKRPC